MKNKILFSFKKKKEKNILNRLLSFFHQDLKRNEISLSFGDATTNIMILGGTGTGKTTSICYPIIYNLITNNCSGLIIDVKGGYSQIARYFNKQQQKCLILGTDSDCEPINLIGGISPYKLREFLKETITNTHSSEYWGSNGIEDIILIYELLFNINPDKCPTLADLYNFSINSFELHKAVSQCQNFEIIKKIRMRTESDSFSLFALSTRNDASKEQKTWQLSSILNNLKHFYEDPYLNHYFCNNNFLNFENLIYENKQTIVLDLPISHYSNVSLFVSKILRARFRDVIKNKGETNLQKLGYGSNLFTFLLIDEYQQYITTKTSLSSDDNNWLDTSRGYGHINILSTQSVDSLIAKSDESSAQQLIGNCRNIIHLGTNAKYSLEHIYSISNQKVKDILKNQYEDCGFFYIGKRNSDRKGENSLIITGKSSYDFMNYFIKNPIQHFNIKKKDISFGYINHYITYEIEDYSTNQNIYIRLHKNVIKKINKNLIIITTTGKSDGFLDFNFILEEQGIYFEEIKVLSIISKNQLPETIIQEQNIFNKNNLIVFIRGGSNFEDSFLNKDSFLNFLKAKKEETGFMLGIAVGHAPHLFKIDTLVDIYGITPTDLGYRIAKHEFLESIPSEITQNQIKDLINLLNQHTEDEK